MRLVLAIMVMLGHSPELIDGNRQREWLTCIFGTLSLGELAVDCFFLLSGYLIMKSWHDQPRPWPFLKKRLLRIYPGFIVASIICAVVVGPLGSLPSTYFEQFQGFDFFRGLVLLEMPAIPSVFEGTKYSVVNGAMWTISKEFECYLFVLVAGVAGVLRVRHFCLVLTLISFALLAWFRLVNEPVIDLRLASCFLSGACYYTYRDRIRLTGVLAVDAAAATVLFMFSWRAAEIVLISVGAYAMFFAAHKRSSLLSRFNRLPDVSYGVYLYGWPIQKLLLWSHPAMPPWMLFALATPAALIMGIGSWYCVEKPALRFKGRRTGLDKQNRDLEPAAEPATRIKPT
jgi:peptidoglycan/LPS O-acetylase OafA/YrhL